MRRAWFTVIDSMEGAANRTLGDAAVAISAGPSIAQNRAHPESSASVPSGTAVSKPHGAESLAYGLMLTAGLAHADHQP